MKENTNNLLCSSCDNWYLIDDIYVGEIWGENPLIKESWWKGEHSPICFVCSILRAQNFWSAYYLTVEQTKILNENLQDLKDYMKVRGNF